MTAVIAFFLVARLALPFFVVGVIAAVGVPFWWVATRFTSEDTFFKAIGFILLALTVVALLQLWNTRYRPPR